MTKTRTQSLVHPLTTYVGYINGVQSSSASLASFAYDALQETISYANSGKKRFMSCTHEMTAHTPCVSRKSWGTAGQPTWLNVSDTLSGDLTPWGVNAPGFPVPSAEFWQDMSYQAMSSLMPSLSKGAPSMINFILELRDLKRMFDLWDKFAKGKVLNAANLHLNISFGWLPTIGDLKKVYNGLANFEKRWNRFVNNQGKVRVAHFKTVVNRDLSLPSSATTYPYGAAPGYKRFNYAWESQPVYAATLKYKYSLPKLNGLSKFRGYLDALGVRLDPQIIWEAIPFSFILDWVLGIGNFLSQFGLDNVPARVVKLDFCHSLKYTAQCNLMGAMGVPTPVEYLSWSTRRRFYMRRAEEPTTFRGLTFGTPGLREGALALSLILVRVIPGLPQKHFRANSPRPRVTSSYNWDRAMNNGPRWQNGRNFYTPRTRRGS